MDRSWAAQLENAQGPPKWSPVKRGLLRDCGKPGVLLKLHGFLETQRSALTIAKQYLSLVFIRILTSKKYCKLGIGPRDTKSRTSHFQAKPHTYHYLPEQVIALRIQGQRTNKPPKPSCSLVWDSSGSCGPQFEVPKAKGSSAVPLPFFFQRDLHGLVVSDVLQ